MTRGEKEVRKGKDEKVGKERDDCREASSGERKK
jgi:hypothetical protein